MRRSNRKVLNFLDRFPFIILIVIGVAVFFIFPFVVSNLPLAFFSGSPETAQEEEELMVFIASPVNEREYELITANETIPIEIKAKDIETMDAVLKVFVNDNEIKSFDSPPYTMNWNPRVAGSFEIHAHAMGRDGALISSSNRVGFEVKYKYEAEEETDAVPVSLDIEEKKERILETANYRAQNGPPLFSYKSMQGFNIDANLDEWGSFERFSAFQPTIKKENFSGPQDLSGTFSSAWDEENFYFVIKVIDDIINQPYTSNQINKGDCIALAFDTDLEGDMQVPFLNDDDFLIEISPGNFAGNGPESFVRWPSNAPLRDAVIASKRTTDGYIIEAAIPWTNFGRFVPEDETLIGFTVSIMDTDNLTDEEGQYITELVVSSSLQFDFNNMFTLGTLVFIDVGDLDEIAPENTQ